MQALKAAVYTFAGVEKPDQVLDPISTLCMLALRTRKYYENAKPAALDHWFYFDRDVRGKATERTVYQVGNDDLYYLELTFTFFARGWKAAQNPRLSAICNVALNGLEIMSKEYHKKRMNAANTCDRNIEILRRWLKAEAEIPLVKDQAENRNQAIVNRATEIMAAKQQQKGAQQHADCVQVIGLLLEELKIADERLAAIDPPALLPPVGLTHDELARIQKINALWPDDKLASFETSLKDKESDTNMGILNQLLEDRKVAYLALR